MTDEKKDEPLEGLDIIDYDEKTQAVTIQIHPLLLKYSEEEIGQRCVEIIKGGPNVDRVDIVPRKK